jgi:hypothetical protein
MLMAISLAILSSEHRMSHKLTKVELNKAKSKTASQTDSVRGDYNIDKEVSFKKLATMLAASERWSG